MKITHVSTNSVRLYNKWRKRKACSPAFFSYSFFSEVCSTWNDYYTITTYLILEILTKYYTNCFYIFLSLVGQQGFARDFYYQLSLLLSLYLTLSFSVSVYLYFSVTLPPPIPLSFNVRNSLL
jgi:hypothetical protein